MTKLPVLNADAVGSLVVLVLNAGAVGRLEAVVVVVVDGPLGTYKVQSIADDTVEVEAAYTHMVDKMAGKIDPEAAAYLGKCNFALAAASLH